MKKHFSNSLPTCIAFLVFQLMALTSFAQVDVDIDLGQEEWYENPVYLVLGGIILVLAIVLISRRK